MIAQLEAKKKKFTKETSYSKILLHLWEEFSTLPNRVALELLAAMFHLAEASNVAIIFLVLLNGNYSRVALAVQTLDWLDAQRTPDFETISRPLDLQIESTFLSCH